MPTSAGAAAMCPHSAQRVSHLSPPPRSPGRSSSAPGPAIVISSSGMATGGRVLHHLANALPDARNTVLLVGFQAAGTRGRR